jgi:hypothetical protein
MIRCKIDVCVYIVDFSLISYMNGLPITEFYMNMYVFVLRIYEWVGNADGIYE